jgi:hypothetical protein
MKDDMKNVKEVAITDGEHEMRNTFILIGILEEKRQLGSLRHG